jgi:hypothetical protein
VKRAEKKPVCRVDASGENVFEGKLDASKYGPFCQFLEHFFDLHSNIGKTPL